MSLFDFSCRTYFAMILESNVVFSREKDKFDCLFELSMKPGVVYWPLHRDVFIDNLSMKTACQWVPLSLCPTLQCRTSCAKEAEL